MAGRKIGRAGLGKFRDGRMRRGILFLLSPSPLPFSVPPRQTRRLLPPHNIHLSYLLYLTSNRNFHIFLFFFFCRRVMMKEIIRRKEENIELWSSREDYNIVLHFWFLIFWFSCFQKRWSSFLVLFTHNFLHLLLNWLIFYCLLFQEKILFGGFFARNSSLITVKYIVYMWI